MKFSLTSIKNDSPLRIVNLGGVSVQKNMFVYEYEDEKVLVDCGIGFAEVDDFGVDITIPDFSYILEKKEQIKGLVLTHAHEDHYSATPFLLREMPLKIFAHPLVEAFVKNKLEDFKDYNPPQFIEISPDKSFTVGKYFEFIPYRVNHSVPNTLGFFIKTPAGVIVHQSDFKFDWTPVMDKPADVQKIAYLAKSLKPVLLLSDSLGSTHKGYTASEKDIEDTFDSLLNDATGQVFITTISSNISRIQQAINSAVKHNRKVIISGRSIENNFRVAQEQGLVNYPKGTILEKHQAKSVKDSNILFIVPGTYGQVGSSLDKIAEGKHRFIKMREGATVIFSGDPIPGMEPQVNRLISKLILRGANVIYSDIQENLHVSGHGSKGDITLMAQLVRAKYLAPIGGDIIHLRAYKDLMHSLGYKRKRVFELLDGESLEIRDNSYIKKGETVPIRGIFIDNEQGKRAVREVLLEDRKRLAENGILVVVIPYQSKRPLPDRAGIYTRGFIFVKDNKSVMKSIKKTIVETINTLKKQDSKKVESFDKVKKELERALQKHLYKRVGEAPLIFIDKIDL